MRQTIRLLVMCFLLSVSLACARVSDEALAALLRNSHSPIIMCAKNLLEHRLRNDSSFHKPYWRFLLRFNRAKFHDDVLNNVGIYHIIIAQNATPLPQDYIEDRLETFLKALDIPQSIPADRRLEQVQRRLFSYPRTYSETYHQTEDVALLGFHLQGEFFGYGVFHDDWLASEPCSLTNFYHDVSYHFPDDARAQQAYDVVHKPNFIFFDHLQTEPRSRLMVIEGNVLIDTQTFGRYHYQPENYVPIHQHIVWEGGKTLKFALAFEEVE